MEKGNLLPVKEAQFAITMSVCFIWSTAKETLLTLKKKSSQICMFCGSTMESLPCKARKVWEFQDDNFVIVKHHGDHSCELKPRKPDIHFDEVLKGGLRKGPTQLQKEYLYDILKKRNPWNYSKKLQMI